MKVVLDKQLILGKPRRLEMEIMDSGYIDSFVQSYDLFKEIPKKRESSGDALVDAQATFIDQTARSYQTRVKKLHDQMVSSPQYKADLKKLVVQEAKLQVLKGKIEGLSEAGDRKSADALCVQYMNGMREKKSLEKKVQSHQLPIFGVYKEFRAEALEVGDFIAQLHEKKVANKADLEKAPWWYMVNEHKSICTFSFLWRYGLVASVTFMILFLYIIFLG